jgi:hypothetical protein
VTWSKVKLNRKLLLKKLPPFNFVKMSEAELDEWISMVKKCKYLPENHFRVTIFLPILLSSPLQGALSCALTKLTTY